MQKGLRTGSRGDKGEGETPKKRETLEEWGDHGYGRLKTSRSITSISYARKGEIVAGTASTNAGLFDHRPWLKLGCGARTGGEKKRRRLEAWANEKDRPAW